MLGIIGLILAIVFMIIGAYKGLGALPLTIISALIVAIFNQINIWTALSEMYMSGYVGTYMSYFLILIFSALYAKVMDQTGCATAIGYKFIDWFGTKNVILVAILITSILTYGGVSLFVCIFAVGPILFVLFKEANLPRHLTIGCFVTGAATYTMTCLPGTTQLTNVIPTQYLGTKLTAAPVLGVLCAASIFIICFGYMQYAAKKAVKAKESFSFPEGYDTTHFEVDRSALPAAAKAFLPMIVLVLFIIIGGRFISDSAMLTVIAMLIGTVLCCILNLDKLKGVNIKKMITSGLGDGISSIGGLAAVVAFGTVVSSSAAFQQISDAVLNVNMSPYFKGIFATAVISGVTGSSSGGVRILLASMSDYFINSGCNLNILHRLMAISAGSLDSLPHASGLFIMLAGLGLTHKEGYKHVFVTTVVAPAVVAIVAALICTVAGL